MNKKHIVPLVVSALFCLALSTGAMKGFATRAETLQGVVEKLDKDPEVTKKIDLSFPGQNQEIDILKPNVVKFINAMHTQAQGIENDYILHNFYVRADNDENNYGAKYSNDTDKVRIDDYAKTSSESRSKNVTLVFDHSGFASTDTFTLKYGQKSDLSDAVQVEGIKENFVTIDNLYSNATYYWQISSGTTQSEIRSFKTKAGFRMITAPGVQNIRDMGGRDVEGNKRIKQGLIFRGGELVNEDYTAAGSTHSKTLYPESKRVLQEELGIKLEIDFRGEEESNNISESPLKDDTHTDIEYMRIPNMPAYHYLLKKNKTAKAENDELLWPMIKEMFLAFKNANNKHVYFHCWGGADRTGTAGFLLGALLGMSWTDLVIDFELTSFAGNYRPHYAIDSKKVYHFPHLLYQIYEGSYLEPFRSEGKHLKDIVADYLIEYAGLTEQDITDIRNNLLEDK